MRAVPATAFCRADALDLGWTDSALSRAVRSGRLLKPRRGWFVVPSGAEGEPIDPRLAAVAAAGACSGSVVSHRSAALLHGLPVFGRSFRPELTVSRNGTGDTAGALVHRARLRDVDVVEVDGIRVTSVARTVSDIGRSRSALHSVPVADAALHAKVTSRDEIADVLQSCRGWPRVRYARHALELADGRAESPLESVSRLIMPRLGLPPPMIQPLVLDERGVVIARLDFYWDEFGVGGEADGRLKYRDPATLVAEKYRQEGVEDLAMVVVRWGWDDAMYRRPVLGSRIRRAFQRGEARDRAGFPRLWSIVPS